MAVTIESDLKEYLDRFEQKLDNLQKDVTDLKLGQAEIKGEIKALDERLSGQITAINSRLKTVETSIQKISDLAEKVGELKNWRQIAVITVTALVSGVVTWLIRASNLRP